MGEVICCVKEHSFMRNLNMCLWQGGWEFWAQVAGFLQFDAPTPRHVKLAVGVVDGNSIEVIFVVSRVYSWYLGWEVTFFWYHCHR